jgi:hypothetical protein
VPTLPSPREHGSGSTTRNLTRNQPSNAHQLRNPGTATGLHLATAITAVTLLVFAVACSLWVVFPRLERRRTAELASEGLVYFGHLRRRDPGDIAAALAALTPAEERRQLAAQLRITGNVAWRKHAWLQRSLALFGVGAILLVVSFVAF